MKNRQELLNLINRKITEVQQGKTETKEDMKRTRKPPTNANVNRTNAQNSTGPRTSEGKQASSANSLKHGYYANIEKLNPYDSPAYIEILSDLRMGLHPDGPAEEHLIREIAMYSARLKRIHYAEFALVLGNIEGEPPKTPPKDDGFDTELPGPDAREVAAAYDRARDQLDFLRKIEAHLNRAYNRSWDRLDRMQKERRKMPLDEALKQTQIHATYEALRNNRPQDVPARHPDLDEKGKFTKREKGDPIYRPKDKPSKEEIDDKSDDN